jgi:hypothetical protein
MAKTINKNKKSSPRYVYTGHEEFPKVNIKLTHQELELLFQEPPEIMKLYIFLNLYRDFNTNVTGESVHIDDASFKLWLGHPGKIGRKAWKPSTTHIIRWLDRLEDLGLIKQLGNHVFLLPKAYTDQYEQKRCHQGVTKVSPNLKEGVTNHNIDETPINTEQNATLNSEVSPKINGGVTEVVQRLYTIPDRLDLNRSNRPVNNGDNVDNFFEENSLSRKIYDLLVKRGYYINHLHHMKTISMINAFIKAGVTLEEVEIGFKHCDSQKNGKPTVPWYYEKAVFQYKANLAASLKNSKEAQANKNTTNLKKEKFEKDPKLCSIANCNNFGTVSSSTRSGKWVCAQHKK